MKKMLICMILLLGMGGVIAKAKNAYRMDRKGRLWQSIKKSTQERYKEDPTNFDYLVLNLVPTQQYADIQVISAGMKALKGETASDEAILTAVQRIRQEQEKRPNQPTDESTITKDQQDEWERAFFEGLTWKEWLELWQGPIDESKAIPGNVGW